MTAPRLMQGLPSDELLEDWPLDWLQGDLDEGLDLPETTRDRISEITWALHQRGRAATPALVATALSRLGCAPIAEDQLATVLMMNWRRMLDEVDTLDPQALHAHWQLAPVREHPLCYYLAGIIETVIVTRWWFGRGEDHSGWIVVLQQGEPSQDGRWTGE